MDNQHLNKPIRSKYEELLANRQEVLHLFQTRAGVLVLDWFQELLDNSRRKMTKEKEHVEMLRSQGRAMLAEELVNLPDELRKYGQDLAAGKVKAL